MSLKSFLGIGVITALLSLIGMILLPHDKYLRYQALNDKSAPRAHWIYQRIHFDATPIDIAFIGSSRTGRSIHSLRLQQDLAARGVEANAVNFYMFRSGRNMHYAIAKELLENRKVKLLVLEITEWEDRLTHPDYVFLADPTDIVFAPMVINFRYLTDLARLPGRQVDLFLQTTRKRLGIDHTDSVLPPYEGPHLDQAEFLTSLDGARHDFNDEHTLEHMEALRVAQEANITRSLLPASLSGLEYRMPRYYIDKTLALAARHGARVVFLFVPRYGGPSTPPSYAQFADRASLINPAVLVSDYRYWSEETHMNWSGARLVTDFVAERIATEGLLAEGAGRHQ
jgi:hypothetical protein